MYFPATLTPYNDGTQRYGITFVDLPGCMSVGESLDDALRMASEALSLHVGTMIEGGDPIPTPSTLEQAREADIREAEEEGTDFDSGTLHQFVYFEPAVRLQEITPIRLSISLKPVVLARIDKVASELGLPRSGLIAVATREYCNLMQAQ